MSSRRGSSQSREQSYTERSIHHVETGFKWYDVINDAASLSLFVERKVLNLRIPPQIRQRGQSNSA